LVFRKPASESTKRLDKIWFYEVRNDGYDPDKISGGGRVETPEKNDIPNLLTQWNAYKSSGFAAPPGLQANTLLAYGSEEPTSWWTTSERLAEADYNLAAGQWKPRVAEETSDEDPRELIAEVMGDYRKVVAQLEKLLAESTE
jgi:type I restriction enzyme M protein